MEKSACLRVGAEVGSQRRQCSVHWNHSPQMSSFAGSEIPFVDDFDSEDELDENDLYGDSDEDVAFIYSNCEQAVPVAKALQLPVAPTDKAFLLPKARNNVPQMTNEMSSEERLKCIRNFNERIEIQRKLIQFEKQLAGQIADEIRKTRAVKVQQARKNNAVTSAEAQSYLDLFSSKLQALKDKATEAVLGSESNSNDVSLYQLWSDVFSSLNEEYVEYDVMARQSDDYFVKCVLPQCITCTEGEISDNTWDLFDVGIQKIINSSPRHSLAKTLRVFAHTLCILHGPLFDLETEFCEMLSKSPQVFSTFINREHLIEDIKCFVEMFVITMERKYSIERNNKLNKMLYVVAQSAIFGLLGDRIDNAIFVRESRSTKSSESCIPNCGVHVEQNDIQKYDKLLFDKFDVPEIFRMYKVDSETCVDHKDSSTSTRTREPPYKKSINKLKSILKSNYPIGRLRLLSNILENVTEEMSKIASSHGKSVAVGAEDLAPVIDFIVSKSQVVDELDYVFKSLEPLVPNVFWSGKFGYALTVFTISVGSMKRS